MPIARTSNGRMMTDSEVRRVLKESRGSAERKAVWEGSKGVGPLVEADLKALVKLRNEAARKLGFPNYHALQLHLNEQSQEQVLKLFDELDVLTREPFRKLKVEIDAKLAEQSGVTVGGSASLALSRPVLPGVAGDLRGRLRLGLRQGRHPQALPRLLRRASACRSTT